MLNFLYYSLFSLPAAVLLLGSVVVAALFYLQSLFEPCDDVPRLHYRDSTLARYVIRKARRLSQPFRPPLWARSCHLQTVLPVLLPARHFRFEREFLLMKDKGIVALDWGVTGVRALHKTSPVLLVLPQMTGDAADVTFLCQRAVHKGFRPMVFNRRGHGHSPLTTPRLQSFGDPTDLRQAVKYVRGKLPGARLTAVGLSGAGAGLLVSYLGEYGSASYLSGAVCVCPGYDSEALFSSQTGVRQPYSFLLLYALKRLVGRHANALAKVIDIDAAMRSSNMTQFEEQLYCRLSGFKDMAQYWDKNNPMRDIDDVSTPVLCINSFDDPICIKDNIPKDLFGLYPNFMLVTTEHGGHCGFLEHPTLECWSDKVALEYLTAILDFTDKHDTPR